jgi:large subunit ribosomal protein L13
MIVIDAKDMIVGRIATFVAKQALLGEEIAIVNSEYAVLSGHKKRVLATWQKKRSMGTWATGPFYHRGPDRMLRRMIRGMLPHKQEKGRDAFKRIMCYLSVPQEFEGKELMTIEKAHVKKLPTLKYTTLKELSVLLGRTGE